MVYISLIDKFRTTKILSDIEPRLERTTSLRACGKVEANSFPAPQAAPDSAAINEGLPYPTSLMWG